MPRTTRLRQLFLAPGFRDFAPRSLGSAVSMTVCGEAGWRERKRGKGGEKKGRRRGQGCNFVPSLVGPLSFSTFDPSKPTKYCIQGMSSLVWCSICQSSLEHPHRRPALSFTCLLGITQSCQADIVA